MKEYTRSTVNGRAVDRSEYAEAIENNNRRVTDNPDYYRQRQQITEHQFGTMKRQMKYTHTNIRGKPMVMSEIGLMYTVYNLVIPNFRDWQGEFCKSRKAKALRKNAHKNRIILERFKEFIIFTSSKHQSDE